MVWQLKKTLKDDMDAILAGQSPLDTPPKKKTGKPRKRKADDQDTYDAKSTKRGRKKKADGKQGELEEQKGKVEIKPEAKDDNVIDHELGA